MATGADDASSSPVRVGATPRAAGMALAGLVGGALGGVAAVLVLVAGAVAAARFAGVLGALDPEGVRRVGLTALNAVGATFVRWLQTAEPTALEGIYLDATLGGALLVPLWGALVGALIAAAGERFPEDTPLAWSLVGAVLLWAVTWWILVPALDPVAARALDGRVVAAAHAAFGLALGAWLGAVRPHVGAGAFGGA